MQASSAKNSPALFDVQVTAVSAANFCLVLVQGTAVKLSHPASPMTLELVSIKRCGLSGSIGESPSVEVDESVEVPESGAVFRSVGHVPASPVPSG